MVSDIDDGFLERIGAPVKAQLIMKKTVRTLKAVPLPIKKPKNKRKKTYLPVSVLMN